MTPFSRVLRNENTDARTNKIGPRGLSSNTKMGLPDLIEPKFILSSAQSNEINLLTAAGQKKSVKLVMIFMEMLNMGKCN